MLRTTKSLLTLLLFITCNVSNAQSLAGDLIGGALGGLGRALTEMGRQEAEDRRILELERQRAEIWAEQQRQARDEELSRQRQAAYLAAAKKARDDEAAKVSERQNGGTGSGFFVTDRGHIVTNAHVVGDYINVLIKDSASALYQARVIRVDKDIDLALLVIERKTKGLKIANATGELKGEEVYAVGYPMPGVQGQESKITNGIVSSMSGFEGIESWMQISAAIQGGNSGGPLVTPKGDVVGVVVAQVNAKRILDRSGSILQNVNYAIKSEHVLEFLRKSGIVNVGAPITSKPLRAVDESTVMIFARDKPFTDSFAARPSEDRLKSNEQVEIEDYEAIKVVASPTALQSYLAKHPTGKNAVGIRAKLLALEKTRWEIARKNGTLQMLSLFINEFPDSASTASARNQLAKLDDAAFSKAIKADTINSLGDYIVLFANGKSIVAAKARYEQLRDESTWTQALQNGSAGAFKTYLSQFPDGEHAAEAKSRVEAVRAEDAKALAAASPPKPKVIAVGKVDKVFSSYGYLVIDMEQGLEASQTVQILALNGKMFQGRVNVINGSKASVLVVGDLSAIQKGDQVVK